jgi:hypothetical protein
MGDEDYNAAPEMTIDRRRLATIGTAFADHPSVTSRSMAPRTVFAPLAIAALSTMLCGCSFAFVNGPPPNHKTSSFFGCTSSNGVPMLDTVAATIGLLDAVSLATGSGSDSNTTTGSRTSSAIAAGAVTAVFAASAAYGFKKTSECREAEADLVRRTPVFTGAPGPFAPRVPQVPYDPWVAHPPAPPSVSPAAPQVPAAPTTAPAAGSSPWDGATPGK